MMARQLPDENPLKERLLLLDELTSFATTYRYVSGTGGRIPKTPDPAETENWIDEVDGLIRLLALRFGADLSAKDKPAKSPDPLRDPNPEASTGPKI
jgi:hypothetical protein